MRKKRPCNGISILVCLFIVVAFPCNLWAEDAPSAYWTDTANGMPINELLVQPGSLTVIRLNAEIPAGKTLKAWQVSMTYDADLLSIEKAFAPSKPAFQQVIINTNNPGTIVANAFDIKGLQGPGEMPIVEIELKGLKTGSSNVNVSFDNYGASATDEFRPAITGLQVVTE